jgi:CcmD family protein
MHTLLIAQEFVPIVETTEVLPAAPLLLTAYGFAWLVILVYMWSIWRRLTRVEGDLASALRRIGERRN